MTAPLTSLYDTESLDSRTLNNIFGRAQQLQEWSADPDKQSLLTEVLPGKQIGVIFYEPSTRTRLCAVSAAGRLGAQAVIGQGIRDPRTGKYSLRFSSEEKHESFSDTLRALACYLDLIVLRTPREGQFQEASAALDTISDLYPHYQTPLINAGDGAGRHPIQALTDVFTLLARLKLDTTLKWQELRGQRIVFAGDLKYGRTVHSLADLLGRVFGMVPVFCAPPGLEMPEEYLQKLRSYGVSCEEHQELQPARFYYVVRTQSERYDGAMPRNNNHFSFDRRVADHLGIEHLMHPFPRSANERELPPWEPHSPSEHDGLSLDRDPRGAYFDQMVYRMPIQMSLYMQLLCPKFQLADLERRRDMLQIYALQPKLPYQQHCVSCSRAWSNVGGWTELPIKASWLRTLAGVHCDHCRPTATDETPA
jgi:aspartate carbamoyltransferase catalytic subunit